MFQFENILTWFRKNFTKRDVLIIAGLILAFFATRLINLDKWPIFSDEGIYIRWAKVAWHDATWRFISLTDGKQPLQTWGTIPFLKFFPENALLAGRLFSVATGFAGLAGMFTLLFYLFNKKTALIGSFLYIITPYFVFYDRMALVDSGVNAGFIWILFFSVLMARTRKLDVALMFGLVAGLALLAKSSVRLFVGLSALAPIFFLEKKLKKNIFPLINFGFLFVLVFGISLVIYNVQRLSPFFHYVALKNNTFIMTFAEWRQDPFAVVFSNIQTIPTYVFWELGFVLVPFAFAGMYTLLKRDWRLGLYLLAWIIIPFVGVALFSRVLFPRYLIFFGSLFFIFAAYFLSSIKNTKIQTALIGVVALWQLGFSQPLLFNPAAMSFPPTDRGQYVEGKTAVWGAKELVEFAREQSQSKPVTLVAEGNFGLVGDVLDVFLKPGDQISIDGQWPLDEKHIVQYQKVNDRKVYFVFSHRTEFPENWPIKLVKKYGKPVGNEAIYLYEYKE